MEFLGLLIKDIYYNSNGRIVLGTIVIDDDTSIKKILTRHYTLPRVQINKEGVSLSQVCWSESSG